MKPTSEQQVAIETQDRPLLVEAGAGTGKTWVLVQRFLHLLTANPPWELDSITAITFTEKAAREMRTRLRREIEEKYRDNPDDAVWLEHWRNLDRLQVSTIHSLCARILRENAIACGLDPQFQVLDEQQSPFVKEQAIEETLRALQEEDHPALALLASLKVMDLRAEMLQMLAKRGELFLSFRNLAEPQALILNWQAGLDEMRGAIWDDCLHNNPDLAFALGSLPYTSISDPEDKLSAGVLLAQQGCRALAQGDLLTAAQDWLGIKLIGGKQASWGGKEALADLKSQLRVLRDAAEILEKASALKSIDQLDEMAAEHLALWRDLWERLEQTYRQLKEAQQALDFDDLEILAERLLQQKPRTARLQAYLDSLQHLMVDEFQDTNLIQQRIVYALAPIDEPGKLFLVGDAKQSIYRFRQAQVSGFSQTAAKIKAATGLSSSLLSTSFRTHHNLVQATNHLFAQVLKPAGSKHADYEAQPGALSAGRASINELENCVEILLLKQKDAEDQKISSTDARLWEAQWIARRLLELRESAAPVWDKAEQCYRPFEYRDAAVLFRAMTHLPLYEAEFKKMGLPYLTISGRGYYDRPEVQDLVSLLSALANPLDDLNLVASLRSPLFSFSDETLYRLRWHTPAGKLSPEPIHLKDALLDPPASAQMEMVARAGSILERLWALIGRVDVWQLLRATLDQTAYEIILAQNDGENGRQRANVVKFLSLARDYGGASVADFLSRLRDLKAMEAREGEALGREPESGAVQLMSIHAAKGLEFPVLVVADLGREKRYDFRSPYLLHDPLFGLVCKVRDEWGDWQEPASYAWGKWLNQKMEEAERKRLLYVACTRAADRLILTGQLSNGDSWLQEITIAFGVDPQGPEDELCERASFGMRVFRPTAPVDIPPLGKPALQKAQGVKVVPPLARPLPAQLFSQPLAASRLGRFRRFDPDDGIDLRPAVLPGKGSEAGNRAPGYLVGEIVHRALAHWHCLSYSEQALIESLESLARRLGVDAQALEHAVRTSYTILGRLKRYPVFADIRAAVDIYREIPFTLKTQQGMVQGVIDLLYQDAQGGWHILDWITEWTPKAEIEQRAQEHLLQMAIYARAVQAQLGVMPQASLYFLSPKVREYAFERDLIVAAWYEVSADGEGRSTSVMD